MASLTGPNLVKPAAAIDLDASASSDPNGDHIRLRWDEMAGAAGCLDAGDVSGMSLIAPNRPQELAFRVFASDGVLESAPADVKVVVSAGADFVVPAVHPGADQRARPGRTVRLDALGGAPRGTQPGATRTYTWTQTLGPDVDVTTESDERVALFTAPEVFDTLAFSVYASLEGVDGDPDVITVTVVKPDENLAPILYVSADDSTPLASTWVTLTARPVDPEGDPIQSLAWLQTDGTSVTLEPLADFNPATDSEAQVKLLAPAGPTTIVVQVTSCDDRSACGDATVSITIE